MLQWNCWIQASEDQMSTATIVLLSTKSWELVKWINFQRAFRKQSVRSQANTFCAEHCPWYKCCKQCLFTLSMVQKSAEMSCSSQHAKETNGYFLESAYIRSKKQRSNVEHPAKYFYNSINVFFVFFVRKEKERRYK